MEAHCGQVEDIKAPGRFSYSGKAWGGAKHGDIYFLGAQPESTVTILENSQASREAPSGERKNEPFFERPQGCSILTKACYQRKLDK